MPEFLWDLKPDLDRVLKDGLLEVSGLLDANLPLHRLPPGGGAPVKEGGAFDVVISQPCL